MFSARLISAAQVVSAPDAIVFDCRFALQEAAAGEQQYRQGHIPGAYYLSLNCDLSGPVQQHGGRHPLPAPQQFAATLARFGVGRDTRVIVYDDSRMAYAARLWWMMCSLGYRAPEILDGGYSAWLAAGGLPSCEIPTATSVPAATVSTYRQLCDIHGVRDAQIAGTCLIDSREKRRYEGLEEPIDPVAGHIPGAINRPWMEATDEKSRALPAAGQRQRWGEDLLAAPNFVVYCGSGVTACVNLFSLALAGREDAVLYGGSWSDWCSYLSAGSSG